MLSRGKCGADVRVEPFQRITQQGAEPLLNPLPYKVCWVILSALLQERRGQHTRQKTVVFSFIFLKQETMHGDRTCTICKGNNQSSSWNKKERTFEHNSVKSLVKLVCLSAVLSNMKHNLHHHPPWITSSISASILSVTSLIMVYLVQCELLKFKSKQ